MASVSEAIDQHIAGSPLEEIAVDPGRLGWRTDAEIEALTLGSERRR